MIRDFTPQDAEPVRVLALKCWRHAYGAIYRDDEIEEFITSFYSDAVNAVTLKMIAEGTANYQILVFGDLMIGFQTSTVSEDGAELRRLYVDPPQIGKGFGRALLSSAEWYFRSLKQGRYTVKVHEKNSLGLGFYKRQGFRHVGQDGSELIYEKLLV